MKPFPLSPTFACKSHFTPSNSRMELSNWLWRSHSSPYSPWYPHKTNERWWCIWRFSRANRCNRLCNDI